MKIIINETKKVEYLSLIDPKTGVDFIADFIGNTGALIDGQFYKECDSDFYVCDEPTFDWWCKVVSDNQALLYRIYDLKKERDSEAVEAVIRTANDGDLEDHAASVNNALDEAFGLDNTDE